MIAQVVFDLPLEGHFDYLVPEHLIPHMAEGMRVNVSFAGRSRTGFVVGLSEHSTIAKLKPVDSIREKDAVFNSTDLGFAREFGAYYGCSLGEALGAMLRNRKDGKPSVRREHKPQLSLYRCRPDGYAAKIRDIIQAYHGRSPLPSFLILVPDAFRMQAVWEPLQVFLRQHGNGQEERIKIGMRSMVFESDGRHDCIIMVDEEDASFKQEQMPMYETRQVLLARSKIYGFDAAFVGISPSVELMAQVDDKQIQCFEDPDNVLAPARPVDLSIYKFIPGLLSPPVRDALDAALKSGKKSILVLNRKGSYRLTRCVDCGEILKCGRCDSPLIYSRSQGEFLCRHCPYTVPGTTSCPKCRKPSWRSQGIGVEQLQSELKKFFPQAKIFSFERGIKSAAGMQTWGKGGFDIVIATRAILRFQGMGSVHMAAFIDFDAELNRLDIRSAFNAFSLALHISSMALESVFFQTRSMGHYVIENLARRNFKGFYDEELKLRKEFGFSPFKHWIKITWRGKSEKSAREAAWQVYNTLNQTAGPDLAVTPPLADDVGRKRDKFHFNVMLQADDVPRAVAFIKSSLAKIKRQSRVVVALNIDP
jgi:primosomal protein N' (replication factor Y)